MSERKDGLAIRLQRLIDAAGGIPADVPLIARVDCLIKQREGAIGKAPVFPARMPVGEPSDGR